MIYNFFFFSFIATICYVVKFWKLGFGQFGKIGLELFQGSAKLENAMLFIYPCCYKLPKVQGWLLSSLETPLMNEEKAQLEVSVRAPDTQKSEF